MKPNYARSLAFVCVVVALAGVGAALAMRQAQPTLAEADRSYEKKSYAEALKAYQALDAAGAVPAARKADVQYRIAVSLGKTNQWDRALAEGLRFVQAHPKTVWEARGLYWLGRLHTGIAHDGYRVGSRIYRGAEVPDATAGTDAPERVFLHEQDQRNALDAMEAARVFYPAFRAAHATHAEEIQLSFDLGALLSRDARLYAWAAAHKWEAPSSPTWRVEPSKPYDPTWPWPKKRAYLSASIRALAGPDKHTAALGLLDHALWLKQYHQVMSNTAVRYVDGKPRKIAYPYQNEKATRYLEELVKRFPNDPVRDQAQYMHARWTAEANARAGEAAMRAFVAARPNSKWAEDAKAFLHGLTRSELRLSVAAPRPGAKPEAHLMTRNVDRVDLTLYQVDLGAAIERIAARKDSSQEMAAHRTLFGSIAAARDLYGPRIARWTHATGDNGDRAYRQARIGTRATQVGAYVLEATAAGHRAATVVLITDLVLIQSVAQDQVHYFAADAASGAPLKGADITVRLRWWEDREHRVAYGRAVTDSTGQASAGLSDTARRGGLQVQGFAKLGRRYAVVGQGWWNSYGVDRQAWQVHVSTDRAVYRPGQQVSYRALVFRRAGSLWSTAAGQEVIVRVSDSRGAVIHQSSATAGEFGTASGALAVPAEAPLGEYQFAVLRKEPGDRVELIGAGQFRVEEYKKPEFEVTVSPSAERIRIGGKASATIKAAYYFGGPVAGAHVEYRVYRTPWAQRYEFPRPYAFLYGDHDRSYPFLPSRQDVVAQGTARTNAEGEALVSFTAAPGTTQGPWRDFTFTVEADVQDASRRTISGSGSLKATRHDVAVFLRSLRGYYTRGDTVEVEVVTLDPSDQPVSVQGRVRIYRLPDDPQAKPDLVWEQPQATDKAGRAHVRWQVDRAGRYRVDYVTRDREAAAPPPAAGAPDPHEVTGSVHFWVSGPELAAGRFLLQKVVLEFRDRYYTEGQTARALLVTPAANCTVLVTREVAGQVIERRVVAVAGRSTELELPITRRDAPNTFVTALMVRGGSVYESTVELFVPPVHGLASLTVTADRERYRPGEKALLQLTARDWQGKPLRAEVSVAVTDAALAYIQRDYGRDIRAELYGNRRPAGVTRTHSGATQFNASVETDAKSPTFRTHPLTVPEGMGQLRDWPGLEHHGTLDWFGYAYRGAAAPGLGGGMGGGAFGDAEMADSAMEAPAAGAPARNAKARGPMPAEAQGAGDEATRSNFVDTAFWTPAVVTDSEGKATVQVTWPDNLTQWRAHAVGVSADAQAGVAEARVTTRKDLLVRLQTPRFMVERDVVTLTANVHNYGEAATEAAVTLALEGETAEMAPGAQATTTVTVRPGGEARVDWQVRVRRSGTLRARASARGAAGTDAVALTVPVIVHGVERQTTAAGVLRETGEARVPITLPEARKPGSSELVVQVSPSLGLVMVDALPYLIDYPYGCVEQTISRFLPAAVVARTLKEAGVNLEELGRRARARDAGQTPAEDPVESSPYTYPPGTPGELQVDALATGRDWWRRRAHSPVFDSAALEDMISHGLYRLARWQRADGGWGWWPDASSDPYMTAYAVYGLLTVREAGREVDPGVLARSLAYLRVRLLEDDNFHRMAYLARVLSMVPEQRAAIAPLVTGRMYKNRERLTPHSRAHLALALHALGDADKARTLLRNMESTLQVDEANGTANWPAARTDWWRWWNNPVEANAVALQAYMAIQPDAPMAPLVMRWLVNNRRGSAWRSTRETAEAVYALAAFARRTGELAADYTLTVDLGGRVSRTYRVTPDTALLMDGTFVVPDALLTTGAQTLTLRREGAGAVYWSAYLRTFSLEEPLTSSGHEVFVKRAYYRLLPQTAAGSTPSTRVDADRPNPFLARRYELLEEGGVAAGWRNPALGPRYERVALRDGETITSGDLVEVELQIEAKNSYEYVVFEDIKPAGCEPVDVRSGGRSGEGLWSNMELRDQKVAFFMSHLPQGRRTISYRMRAEGPGSYHVLPTNGYAMYAPEVRGISDELRLNVQDRTP